MNGVFHRKRVHRLLRILVIVIGFADTTTVEAAQRHSSRAQCARAVRVTLRNPDIVPTEVWTVSWLCGFRVYFLDVTRHYALSICPDSFNGAYALAPDESLKLATVVKDPAGRNKDPKILKCLGQTVPIPTTLQRLMQQKTHAFIAHYAQHYQALRARAQYVRGSALPAEMDPIVEQFGTPLAAQEMDTKAAWAQGRADLRKIGVEYLCNSEFCYLLIYRHVGDRGHRPPTLFRVERRSAQQHFDTVLYVHNHRDDTNEYWFTR